METDIQVGRILVEGSVCRDMYDEHPGLAYFYQTGHRCVPLQYALPMATAKVVAEHEWARLHPASAEDDDPDDWEEYDGQFTPERVLLLARDGTTVQCFENGQWVRDFVPAAQWEAELARAAELSSEASFEAGWDNFGTAERLRERASVIRRNVAIAKANAGRTQRVDSIRGLSERCLLAMARIATVAWSASADDARQAAFRAACALGIREHLGGIVEPPLMFDGESILLAGWHSGRKWAQTLLEGFPLGEDEY
jgi:hypothetical protein